MTNEEIMQLYDSVSGSKWEKLTKPTSEQAAVIRLCYHALCLREVLGCIVEGEDEMGDGRDPWEVAKELLSDS